MNSAINPALHPDSLQEQAARPEAAARWQRYPTLALAFTALFFCFLLIPPVRGHATLQWTFIGIGSGFLLWQLILMIAAKRSGRAFPVEVILARPHYVQAMVQIGIMLYWGWHAPVVFAEMPLILSQLVFLYAFDALLAWSRGRTWRFGFGPFPIIFSTNLLLWFKNDWFFFQFLMVAIGALGKQYITWQRDGKRTHIFNPSSFGQFLFAVVLIATATSNDLTWGKQIATTFESPHMLIVIFLGGLVVQYLFHVTLMTFAAGLALYALNLIYTQITGTYFFVNVNIAAPIFLGIHLLVTDPSTAPKSNLGRVIFGGVYGVAYFVLFRVLDLYEVPLFWDKLLPVPFLNLGVRLLDRVTRKGIVGRLNHFWESTLKPGHTNLVHMSAWAGLFVLMVGTGFIEAPHPGDSIPFWKKAFADGKPHAGHSLVMAAGAQAVVGESAKAYNELGLICMEGKIPGVQQSNARAAGYFAKASELGNLNACANVALQYIFLDERISDGVVLHALDRLEQECGAEPDWGICFFVAAAYEKGRGRPRNIPHALALYERCGRNNSFGLKGIARVALSSGILAENFEQIVRGLEWTSGRGDAESCWYLAYLYRDGIGVQRDEQRARELLEQACKLESAKACAALASPTLPPYSSTTITVPPWSSAYPTSR